MKTIPLTQGKVALVDDEDYDLVSTYQWCALKSRNTFYAGRHWQINGRCPLIRLHRFLFYVLDDGPKIDHIDGDGLNNTRLNLRPATDTENARNRPSYWGVSSYKGVSWFAPRNKWRAQICVNRIQISLGLYHTQEEAYGAYLEASARYFGDFAMNKKVTR